MTLGEKTIALNIDKERGVSAPPPINGNPLILGEVPSPSITSSLADCFTLDHFWRWGHILGVQIVSQKQEDGRCPPKKVDLLSNCHRAN